MTDDTTSDGEVTVSPDGALTTPVVIPVTPAEPQETVFDIVLDPKQQEAVALCVDVTKRLVGVTGPAGSGKTTIMKIVHHHLTQNGYIVYLCAPTGKASKRIEEATGIKAATCHRTLRYSYPGERDEKTGKVHNISEPMHDRESPLECDVLMVDEYMMVNLELHRNLVDALKPGARLLAFGDTNQLDPIEDGRTLTDTEYKPPFITLLEKFSSVKLDMVHRQAEGSGILMNAQRILRGFMVQRKADFDIRMTDDPAGVLTQLVKMAKERGVNYGTPQNQIITCGNKGWVGVHKLNALLQNYFEDRSLPTMQIPRNRWDKEIEVFFRKGSKVIMARNDYQLLVFNGETGIIRDMDTEEGHLLIDFGDREVTFPPEMMNRRYDAYAERWIEFPYDPRKELYLAYALTTHKTQGSEYDNVVYIMNRSHYGLLNRRNFYTAATRAKKHVTIITEQRAIQTALKTVDSKPMQRK